MRDAYGQSPNDYPDDEPILTCRQCFWPYMPWGKDDGFCCDYCEEQYDRDLKEGGEEDA